MIEIGDKTIPLTEEVERALSPTATLMRERDEIEAVIAGSARFLGLGSSIPSGQRRILRTRLGVLNTELKGIKRIQQALELGYEPYTPPQGWTLGLADVNDLASDRGRRTSSGVLLPARRFFNAPMPLPAIVAWGKARNTGLFSLFMVGSADKSLFAESPERPRTLMADPVLIGLIVNGGNPEVYGYAGSYGSLNGMVGFMIAQWDLSKELDFDK